MREELKDRLLRTDHQGWDHRWLPYLVAVIFIPLGVILGWLLAPAGISPVWECLSYCFGIVVGWVIGGLILAYIDIHM